MWKTMAGRCIYQSPAKISVYQNPLYRWLRFDSRAIQTLINRLQPERPGLDYVKPLISIAREFPGDCCLLGLGGAGVAHALKPYIHQYQFTVVENSAEVIQIADKYFNSSAIPGMRIIQQDANVFVDSYHARFSHIMIDLFDAHSFPQHCNNELFFSHCKNRLMLDGILAINLANYFEQWPIFQIVRKTFEGRTVSIPVKKTANLIVFAINANSTKSLLQKLQSCPNVNKTYYHPKWGFVAD